ncbi:hypothetical protein EBB07_04850 [Paenibacillaceae bacterium]|nr:hypothetical protein EBB07_04850 [Paenibacillaceae bacterium]
MDRKSGIQKKATVSVIVLASTLLLICLLVSLSAADGRSSREGDPVSAQLEHSLNVAAVNGLFITSEELQYGLNLQRAMVVEEFLQLSEGAYHDAFWDTPVGASGETPLQALLDQALESVMDLKLELALAKEYGLLKAITYSSLMDELALENERRSRAVKAGEPVYGPVQMDEAAFIPYYVSKLRIDLQRLLEDDGLLDAQGSSADEGGHWRDEPEVSGAQSSEEPGASTAGMVTPESFKMETSGTEATMDEKADSSATAPLDSGIKLLMHAIAVPYRQQEEAAADIVMQKVKQQEVKDTAVSPVEARKKGTGQTEAEQKDEARVWMDFLREEVRGGTDPVEAIAELEERIKGGSAAIVQRPAAELQEMQFDEATARHFFKSQPALYGWLTSMLAQGHLQAGDISPVLDEGTLGQFTIVKIIELELASNRMGESAQQEEKRLHELRQARYLNYLSLLRQKAVITIYEEAFEQAVRQWVD